MIDYKDIKKIMKSPYLTMPSNAIAVAEALRDCRNELCSICGDKGLDYYDKSGKRKSCCSKCRWRDE